MPTLTINTLPTLLPCVYLDNLDPLLLVIMPPQSLPGEMQYQRVIRDPRKFTQNRHVVKPHTEPLASLLLIENYIFSHIYNITPVRLQ